MDEDHAEIKDRCDTIENKLDEIALDMKSMNFNYKFVEEYTNIDREVCEIHEWYDKNRELIKRYLHEKENIKNKLCILEKNVKKFNNNIQNNKSQKLIITKHGGSFSQLI